MAATGQVTLLLLLLLLPSLQASLLSLFFLNKALSCWRGYAVPPQYRKVVCEFSDM
jgi:hypothetical protein